MNSTISELTSEMRDEHRDSMSFGLFSRHTEEDFRRRTKQITDLAKEVSSYLCTDSQPIDEHGRRLINYDINRKWFFENVTFIFVQGLVFDEDDTKHMNAVLECFRDIPNKAYLNNVYYLLNFSDEIAQALEAKRPETKGGNYHIMMGVINAAKGDELKQAPAVDFRYEGVVYCDTDWDTVEKRIAFFVENFGLIFEQSKEQNVQIKNQQRITRSNYFDLDPSVDATAIMNTRIEEFPRGEAEKYFEYNKRENMRVGRAFGQHRRGERNDEYESDGLGGDFRMKAGNDLYSRINNASKQALPARQKGAVLKMDEYYLPRVSQQAEFVLYDDPGAYNTNEGNNIVAMTNPDMKVSMPQFGNTNYSGQRSRRVASSQPIFPK